VLRGLIPDVIRLAFVLHDMFRMSSDEIGGIAGRPPMAARQLASRARRQLRRGAAPAGTDLAGQRQVVEAFLAALRAGDFEALVAVLDRMSSSESILLQLRPGASRRSAARAHLGPRSQSRSRAVHASRNQPSSTAQLDSSSRDAGASSEYCTSRSSTARCEVDVVADPDRLRKLDLAVLDDVSRSPVS
jgi:hypothetical protein